MSYYIPDNVTYKEIDVKSEHLEDREILETYKVRFFFSSLWSSKFSILTATIIYIIWALLLHYGGLHFAVTLASSFVYVILALSTFFVNSIVTDNFDIYRKMCTSYDAALSKIENFTVLITSGVNAPIVKNGVSKTRIMQHMRLLDELVTAASYSLKHGLRGDFDFERIPISPQAKEFICKRICTHHSVIKKIGTQVSSSMYNNAIESSAYSLIKNMYDKKEIAGDVMRLALSDFKDFNDLRGELDTMKRTKFLPPRSGMTYAGLLFLVFFLSPELNTTYGVYYGFLALLVVVIFYHIAVTGSEVQSQMWVDNNVYAASNGFNMDQRTARTILTNHCLFETWKTGKEIDTFITSIANSF
jgi:hypothetical protein